MINQEIRFHFSKGKSIFSVRQEGLGYRLEIKHDVSPPELLLAHEVADIADAIKTFVTQAETEV